MDKEYKDDKMSAEEVDQELKRVQLQRERMQLDKELARQEMKGKVSSAVGTSSNILLEFFLGILDLIIDFATLIRHNAFKIILIFILLFGAIASVTAFDKHREETFLKSSEDHISKTCGPSFESAFDCMMTLGTNQCFERAECRLRERKIFTEKNKPFLLFD